MEQAIAGRETEKTVFRKFLASTRPEFVALYGRRRVGKTFLVSEFFEGKGLYFEMTGSKETSDEVHRARFSAELSRVFHGGKKSPEASTWEKAFEELKIGVDKAIKADPGRKIILFFDELPWIAQTNSDFLGALDYHWNRYFSKSAYRSLILIISGSAASWIIRTVVNSKGGLHNRVTHVMRLAPFTLEETEQYLHTRGCALGRKQILELFMSFGGIPLYLSFVEKGESASQAIDRLCFQKEGFLVKEFERLFQSLFENHPYHMKIVRALAATKSGLSRKEILFRAKLPNSGDISMAIQELMEAGFIMAMPPFGKKRKDSLYRLIDEYSVFYMDWIEPAGSHLTDVKNQNYWSQKSNSAAWNVWAGYAFEGICLKHIDKIKKALGIAGVLTCESSWREAATHEGAIPGAQIDLIIDRADRTVNLCEIKFSNDEYVITKKYQGILEKRKVIFQNLTKTKKHLFHTFISTYGAKKNDSYVATIDNQITMDALF